MNPIAFIPAKRRIHRKRRANLTTIPPGPVLVGATFDAVETLLTLVFDRAINTDFLVPDQITLLDGTSSKTFTATGSYWQDTDESVTIFLVETSSFVGTDVTLNVIGGAGIVASEDDVAWGGVTNVALPFP